ncbi:hypothetical protein tinsulaeT_06370 [Thalassotalea insulae]|uniref:CBS domain-containing protein n=1 Tax=Thalassotalea insulae TaxID=2056778 RepID=A0ABQ6GRP7_9GAMM|nr:CBS domain-containing protein [Thalassotalea insulae]GLX77297.1 hypothetical protein tinsulaeT_06370 [Thalassotalea insulae]
MKNLHLFNLEQIDQVVSPEYFEQTTLASPADKIFTDFKAHQPLVIDGDTLAQDALTMMRKSHVQMKIVVSHDNDFLGIISTNELSEQSLLAEMSKGVNREDILVTDMMLAKQALHAFDYSELQRSSVNDVVTTLKSYGLRHCLVVDRQHHHIRGVISTSDIARKLHLPIDINIKTSFSELFEVIHGKAVC